MATFAHSKRQNDEEQPIKSKRDYLEEQCCSAFCCYFISCIH